MGGRDENRIFIGGIGWNTTERILKNTFSRYGKILDCLVMTDRNTGRPRGFAFLTFADRRSAEDALRDMHGRELDGRVISVNRADPKAGTDEPDSGYGGTRGSRDNTSYRTESRSDECFKCGRVGHWARDCPSSDRAPKKFETSLYVEDRFGDHFHETRFSDRDRLDSRDRYAARDRYETDRYPVYEDRFGDDRFVARSAHSDDRFVARSAHSDDRFVARSAHSGYPRERSHERYRDVRASDRYLSGGPARYEQGTHRDRPGPYDHHPRKGTRVSAYDRY